MKKISIFFGLMIFIVFWNTDSISAEELSEEDIFDQFERISNEYEIGEVLSQADQEFVKRYAKKEGGIQLFGEKSFSKTGTSGTTKVQIAGKVYASHGVLNNTFGGTFGSYLVSGPKPKQMKNYLEHTAFGLIGSGGVGKVYSKTLTSTCTGTSCVLTSSRDYTASASYSTTRAWVDVTKSNGSKFTVKGI